VYEPCRRRWWSCFAGGFVSIHAGEIPIEKVADQLAEYLTRFDDIVELYRYWSDVRPRDGELMSVFDKSLHGRPEKLRGELVQAAPRSVFDAYNIMTNFATHRMRSCRTAFDLLERINAGFQERFRSLFRRATQSSCSPASNNCSRSNKSDPNRTSRVRPPGVLAPGGFFIIDPYAPSYIPVCRGRNKEKSARIRRSGLVPSALIPARLGSFAASV
jgi:hypothetical protein